MEFEIVDLSETDDPGFAEWCIVELMGHRKLAGWVTEEQMFAVTLLRIDIPGEPTVTQYYSPSALYALTPTTEEFARQVAERFRPEPVSRWELQPMTDGSPF